MKRKRMSGRIGVVLIISVSLVLVAACSTEPTLTTALPSLSDPSPTLEKPSETSPQDEKSKDLATSTPSTKESAMPTELNLREANVIAVRLEHVGGDEYVFHVTLQHDDEGESPNFADWWQVEDLEGNVLGRRVLLHAHSNEPFTRSTTVTIPTQVDTVILRGHDMLHGYGGQAMQVNLATGETDAFDEGSELSE